MYKYFSMLQSNITALRYGLIFGHLPVVKTLARAGGVYAVDDVSYEKFYGLYSSYLYT